MELFKRILKESKKVDEKFDKLDISKISSVEVTFKVPNFHPRIKEIKEYSMSNLKIEEIVKNPIYTSSKNKIFLLDKTVSQQKFVKDFVKKQGIKPFILSAIEDKVKIKHFLEDFIEKNRLRELKEDSLVIVIGGGLLLNIGAYVSEQLSAGLILFPTTVLSMADGSGGKVRANTLSNNRAYKHYYKSFYEPNTIFIDKRFLDTLPEIQIKIGLVEIIKHGIYQSSKLHEFLMKEGENLFKDKAKLLKAIFWAAELKGICMEIDVEENENGSRRILRGGHGFSDRLEEDLKLKIPHGFAVSIGIIKQLEFDGEASLLEKAKKIFDLFEIPKTIEEFKKIEK